MRIERALDYDDMSRRAARDILREVRRKPDLLLGVATGDSPTGTYERLARERGNGVERVTLLREADFVLAPLFPRARAVDGFAIHVKPRADGEQELLLVVRNCAVSLGRNVEQQRAILRRAVHEQTYG